MRTCVFCDSILCSASLLLLSLPIINLPYLIAGKFGGNYICRFDLQPLKLNIGGINFKFGDF